MSAPLTPSEEFVLEVCKKSCLEFWCYNNPKLPNGKELCDVLVVFENHVLIISVKDIGLRDDIETASDEELRVAHDRWTRKAVEASVSQIYGAEKSLSTMTNVLRSDGSLGAELPELSSRIVHRLAVAFGSRGKTVIVSGDLGKGFVHVMNEESFSDVLTELDTISELTDYLLAKEGLSERVSILLSGSEANLLACYLFNNRKFPYDTELLVVEDNSWEKLQNDPAFLKRKEANANSYQWDRLITFMASADSSDMKGKPLTLSEKDLALREMARETRFNRRVLQHALDDFLHASAEKKTDARIARNPESRCVYVFRYFHYSESREERVAELMVRCMSAPEKAGAADVAVGIGFTPEEGRSDYEITLTFVQFSSMTDDDYRRVVRFAKENGIGAKSSISHVSHKEYPEL